MIYCIKYIILYIMNKNLLLCLVFMVPILILIYSSKNKEHFSSPIKRTIYNIIPTLDKLSYLGTIIPENNSDYSGNLVITNSLKSGSWKGPILNSSTEPNSVIIDLCYNLDMVLMCVSLKISNNTKIYSIFIKENKDIRSKWKRLESNENIRSITFDLKGNLLGCEASTGQIYRKNSNNADWYGPINYDKPMKKILFDKDGIMLGIGLLDHKIYKKMTMEWDSSEWDNENVNNQRVYDLLHDTDGKLLATSYNDIIKQTFPDYLSNFTKYKDTHNKENNISFDDIIKYKCGVILSVEQFQFSEELRDILNYKKNTINFCKSRNSNLNGINMNLKKNNKQNETIDELKEMISKIKNSFK
jgi:hypothetical protein